MERSFTVGCDPEFFLYDEELGRYVSAIPFVKGTKRQPEPLNSGGYVMRDNVAIEFGMPPAASVGEWLDNINHAIRDIENYIPDWLTLTPIASADFPRQQLNHPEALEIGCEQDYNAWTGGVNIPPAAEFAANTFRSCGAHIHTGFVEGSGYDFLLEDGGKRDTIKAFDCVHGMWSVLLDNTPESIARRDIYGKAGCYRPTDYGIEYRTLSNFWTTSDSLKELMFRFTGDALEIVRKGQLEELIALLGGGDEIQRVINEGDTEWVDGHSRLLQQYLSKDTITTLQEVFHAKQN